MAQALDKENLPRHIVIIMDGNGRWAGKRGLPRAAGHRAGVINLRKIVEYCVAERHEALTVYAFSSENWRRPDAEVKLLMELFISALNEQVSELHKHQVNIAFIGDQSRFPQKLQDSMTAAVALTHENSGLQLRIAANYGGRWDITSALKSIVNRVSRGEINLNDVNESLIQRALCLADLPEPDLFIRTGGERRISNYLLWQIAYTEMYFSDLFWPDFSPERLSEACQWYATRQRRFGRTAEQLK